MSADTRTKLLVATLETLRDNGIARTSARTIAATAGVNQALVFYHFGSVEALLAAACRYGAEQRVAVYRPGFAQVSTFADLAELGREMRRAEREGGHVAFLGQLLAAGQTQPEIAAATTAGLGSWISEIETALGRLLSTTPLGEFVDIPGLARALAASFIGLQLYEGVDEDGASQALHALEQLAGLAAALADLGPVAQRAVRHHLRRSYPHVD